MLVQGPKAVTSRGETGVISRLKLQAYRASSTLVHQAVHKIMAHTQASYLLIIIVVLTRRTMIGSSHPSAGGRVQPQQRDIRIGRLWSNVGRKGTISGNQAVAFRGCAGRIIWRRSVPAPSAFKHGFIKVHHAERRVGDSSVDLSRVGMGERVRVLLTFVLVSSDDSLEPAGFGFRFGFDFLYQF